MNAESVILGTAAWLGAIVDRLRRGHTPLPAEWQDVDADHASFGGAQLRPPPDYAHGPFPAALTPLLRELHARLRGRDDERSVWDEFLRRAPLCPPDDVVEDLLGRDVDTILLGHLPLPDRLLWRFAEHVDEALLTLAKRRLIDPSYTADQFEEVLYSFPTHRWMLESLAWMARERSPKTEVLLRYLAPHPERDSMLKGAPEWLAREVVELRG